MSEKMMALQLLHSGSNLSLSNSKEGSEFMKKSPVILMILASLVVVEAQAQSRGRTQMEVKGGGSEKTLREQSWGLSAQMGAVAYTDNQGDATSRIAFGAAFDWNLNPLIREDAPTNQYLGLATGLLYSHPGASDSNFLGGSESSGNNSDFLFIPLDAKIGYDFTDSFRLSVRGGGNLIYRSNPSVSNIGAGTGDAGGLWKLYPNIGLDADIQLSENFSLTVRPDITLTPGNDLYVATIGATYVGF